MTQAALQTGEREQKQVRRQWQLLHVLAGLKYGLTLEQLSRLVGVCQRTIRRDLDVLVQAGFPIEKNHEAEGIEVRFVWGSDLSVSALRIIALEMQQGTTQQEAGR